MIKYDYTANRRLIMFGDGNGGKIYLKKIIIISQGKERGRAAASITKYD
jgi:hypothetical protein